MINLQSYKLITNNDNVVANRFVIYWWNTCYLTIYLYTKGTSELSEPLAIIVLNYNEQTSAFRFSFKIIAPFLSIAPVSYFFFLLLKRKSQLRVSFNLLVCLTDSFSNRFLRPFFSFSLSLSLFLFVFLLISHLLRREITNKFVGKISEKVYEVPSRQAMCIYRHPF